MKHSLEHYLTPDAVEALLAWYRSQRRDLPWRATRDPYRIWLSEIMLQQTRVEAVKPYYARFLEACPTVEALAALPEERLLKLWEGLGYYSRARNLQRAAREIVAHHGGALPADYEALLRLPGIGAYTAGAVASIAFDIRVPAVDGNVLRVLSRLTGCDDPITEAAVKRDFCKSLTPVIPRAAGDFTQALIELGATVCGPNAAPRCEDCPLCGRCRAHAMGWTDILPVRGPKRARRVEKKTVLLIGDGERTLLCRRPLRGLLAGMYELPNEQGHLERTAIVPLVCALLGEAPVEVTPLPDATHIFTHVEWKMIAYRVRVRPTSSAPQDAVWADNGAIEARYAVPSAFSAYMKYLQQQ